MTWLLASASVLVFLLCALSGQPALAQAGGNLLPNPSFEEAGEGDLPAQWQSHCTGGSHAGREATAAHTGQACGHIVKVADGESHVAALVFPRVEVQGGAEYTLSGWGKGEVPAGGATLFLYQYNREGQWLGNYFHCPLPPLAPPRMRGGMGGERWMPLHCTDQVRPDCAWVQVRFEIYGQENHGEAWVDDVYFGQDTAPPPPVRDLQATAEGGTVRLTWAPPDTETPFGYQVFRAPYPRFAPAHDALVGFTQQTHFEEPIRLRYAHYYAVVAVDEALNLSAPVFGGPVRPPEVSAMPERVVWTAGPAKRWGPELPWPLPEEVREANVEMARGEWESVQVLVGAPKVPLHNVTVRLEDLPGPGGAERPSLNFDLHLQEYVQLAGQARWLPDPLPPNRAADIESGMLRGWWILVQAPEDATPGNYRAQVVVTAEGLPPAELLLKIKVWPLTLPRGNHYGGSWGIWGQQLAEQEQVPVGSEEYQRLYRRYWEFFLEHRMIPRGIPADLESEEGAKWLNDERVASFAISTTGPWAQPMNPEQLARFQHHCRYLRDHGWLDKGYVYIYDEPTEETYPDVIKLCQQVREAGRDVPILLTEQPEEKLSGWVDVWCPRLDLYAPVQDRCRERQKLGEKVWWYVCLAPQPPWPNYLLTNDPIDGRVLSWLQVKQGVQGELYWAVTCFPGNVWEHGLPAPWPGDGYLCYPGQPHGLDGPVTCLRAEAIRDGKEDIELLWLLRHLAAEKSQAERAEEVIAQALAQVCRDFTDYTKQDEDLAAARRMMAEEILRLQLFR